jgi:hypothetical protein
MSVSEIQTIIDQVEQLLQEEELSERAELAIGKLLNLVEVLSADQKTLADKIKRLEEQLEQKKKAKTTDKRDDQQPPPSTDHSSDKRRRKREPKQERESDDRRSFKKLVIHQTIDCPLDPACLPEDAVRCADERVIVQDIEIRPHNICFLRHIFYSRLHDAYCRGELPAGYDQGDFGANLRALIVSLKYSGNMSEPKIGEFLENFDVQVSSGSLSHILTKSADHFEQEYHDLLIAGLTSTEYQQTDDTSARVNGAFWHTHILCNPFYTFYSTRPRKDRLAVLEVLQNTDDLHFRFDSRMLELLEKEFKVPEKWRWRLLELGDVEMSSEPLKALLNKWFGGRNGQLRTAIEQAAAITYYQQQTSVPVVKVLVCDDAGQFKLLTDKLALCWIHAGRHYEKLTPVVGRHAAALDAFRERYWDYYAALQDYRAGPSESLAASLRKQFDELFSTRTGYDALDDRISKTAAKREELLTVLSEPSVPLHNNASELGARVSARRRDVSLHSRSERGARAMDVFTTLVQTAKKLGVSAYAYVRDRFRRSNELPSLAQSVAQAAASI